MLKSISVCAAGAVLACAGLCAPLAFSEIPPTVLTVQASNQSGAGMIQVDYSQGLWDGAQQSYTWSQVGAVNIVDLSSGGLVATLSSCSLTIRLEPTYKLDVTCAVLAGGSETTFTIDSALVGFPLVDAASAQARASASISLTDANFNGATLRGLGTPGSGAFRSYLNPAESTNTLFDHLVASVATTGGTTISSQADPLFGYRSTGVAVGGLMTQNAFTLTGGDNAVITTTLDVVKAAPCADLDGNGTVELADLNMLLGGYGLCSGDAGYNAAVDLSGDGCIDFPDMSILLGAYGQTCE